VALIASAFFQYQLFRENLDDNLEASLTLEGRVLVDWLAQALSPLEAFSPFYSLADRPNEPTLLDYTGSSWVLLRSNGEVATREDGTALYEYPAGASAEVEWHGDLELVKEAALGETLATDLLGEEERILKRIYLPVREVSGIITEPWVLAGQAGEGAFADLYQRQRVFWLTASILAAAAVIFLLLLFRGIVSTQRLEQTLRRAEESIEFETLASTLAHELRNPLMIVQSSAEILGRDEDLSSEGRSLLSDLVEEVGRAQNVLTSHLHPERAEEGEIEDLVVFLKSYWERRRALLQTHRLELETHYPSLEESLRVAATESRFEQILDNLLRNSFEALPEGGTIACQVRAGDREATVLFQDNGPGMREERHFWYQGWRVKGGKTDGKGIGLRLARKWMARWGGEVSARTLKDSYFSEPRGTEVTLALKRVPRD
jgi:signal transduction histidine kinase